MILLRWQEGCGRDWHRIEKYRAEEETYNNNWSKMVDDNNMMITVKERKIEINLTWNKFKN